MTISHELVGRTSELERLDRSLDLIENGEATFLAVEGEPGIGKSSLLDALRARAEARGHRILAATAAEFERDVPFGLWMDALDSSGALDGSVAGSMWEQGAGEAWGAPGGGLSTLPDERYRTHRALRRLLVRMADERPVVVVLDD